VSLTGIVEYLRPHTVEQAFGAIGPAARPLAGGTDLILHAPRGVTTLIDLHSLPLDYIRQGDGFRIGANTLLAALEEHPGLSALLGGVLPDMLRHVGSPLLRNAATLGGHLARGRLSDVVPVLLALDASITIFDGISRTLTLEDFYRSRTHERRMLITEVGIPAPSDRASAAFVKLSRSFFDLAMLNCACRIDLADDGSVAASRVAVGETPALAAPVAQAEAALRGTRLTDGDLAAAADAAGKAIHFGADSRASAEYRVDLCRTAVRRCLTRVRDRLGVGP
jgi:CO/xanthine dehydrogenase FAD-binding subunit